MEEFSEEVKSVFRFLKKKNIWHIHTNNPKVISCGDAASKRKRLGHVGIPIFDELKTELGYYINQDNKKERILVHCRGNQKVDRLKVSSILNAEYQRENSSTDTKGLINPFGRNYRNLLQIFDISTTKKYHPPYTMMTNAGGFNEALEFRTKEVRKKLKKVIIEDIVRVDNYTIFKRHSIGILTGNGPDSGIHLWKRINQDVKDILLSKLNHSFRGDLSYPEIIVESIPEMGLSMELDARLSATEKVVEKAVIDLCKRGASLICIACNTTQYFHEKIEETCELYDADFISMPEVLDEHLIKNDITEFDFLGISYAADLKKYSGFKGLSSKYRIDIPESKILSKINDIAFNSKKGGKKGVNLVRDIIQRNTRTNNVVIALTEITTLLAGQKKILKEKNGIDTLNLLANKIAHLYVEGIFQTLYVDKSKDYILYQFLTKRTKKKYKLFIWNILCEIDHEFIPPLSYRDSTTFKFDTRTKETAKPKAYYEELLEQEFIVSIEKDNGEVTGFMSYKPDFIIKQDDFVLPSNYVTTVGVTIGERGNGITRQFYLNLEKEVRRKAKYKCISTRTWTTNKTHIKILLSLGFKEVLEIKNDRGPGIHTVYYAKKISDVNGSM